MGDIQYPNMRNEIVSAVHALADRKYQWAAWVRRELPPGRYDEFTYRIHVLYDDTQVLEDPDGAVGVVLRSTREADAMRELASAINALFDSLGTELSDEQYLRAPGWGSVVEAANEASRVLDLPA
jgi:hypothetical protein